MSQVKNFLNKYKNMNKSIKIKLIYYNNHLIKKNKFWKSKQNIIKA